MTKLFFFLCHLGGAEGSANCHDSLLSRAEATRYPLVFYRLKLTFMMETNSAGQQSFDLCVKEESNRVKVSPEGNYSLAAQARSSLSLLRLILR